ncbi:MAG TPA: DNA primase [Candidatus Dormibacteraeota bacterium]|jgi:DNA primase|nr:DNA primase [Candidatus Dormibacteraeota bacterium]
MPPVDAVAEIKSRLDIIDVVGGYVRLQRSGREFKGLCPFHGEKTPSFMVNQERQVFHCHGCGEGGDLLTFVQKIERLDFRETLEMLAERAGVELTRDGDGRERRDAARKRKLALDLHTRAQAFYEHVLWNTPTGEPGRALLTERGVGEELARQFGVGFAPSGGGSGDALIRYLLQRHAASNAVELAEAGLAHTSDRGGPPRDRFRHRLLFPIRNERGETIAFGGRALGDAIPKYLNSPATAVYDKSQAIFGIDRARKPMASSAIAVVVEGYFDVLAAHSAGVDNAVASSGTALTREQVRILSRHASSVVLCFDGDDAGRAAASRAVDVVAAESLECRICVLPDGFKDPDELVQRDPVRFAEAIRDAPREWQVLLDRAVGDGEGGSVDARRNAAERAVALLARIPAAAARDLYVQQAAQRLDLQASSIAEDVDRVRRTGRGPVRVTAPTAPAPAPAAQVDAAREEPDPAPPNAWESYLGTLVVQRPMLATALTGELGLRPDELRHAGVRRIIEVALSLEPSQGFPVHVLGSSEQRLAARLLVRSLPELQDVDDPEPLRRALSDCVAQVRAAEKRAEILTIQRELRRARDAGQSAEADQLATRLHQLATERQRIRQAQ